MDIKPPKNTDGPGLVRRQGRGRIGDFNHARELKRPEMSAAPADSAAKTVEPFKLETADIEENVETKQSKPKFLGRLKPSYIRRNFSWRRFVKKSGLALGTLAIVGLGYLGYKLFFAVQNIIDRDSGGALALQGDIDPSQLRGEGDGRVNIVLIGIGGDRHQGGDLADTIIVASLDPFNKEVAMLSVPRDLRVPIPGQWSTKVNAAHALGEESGFNEAGYPKDGPGLLQKTLEQTLGIPIHYYARVDFAGFEQAVKAVDGVSVNVPETVCDYTIAWQYGFSCINAGQQDFDSKEAIFYARTRASARGDFDRGARQRLVLVAMRDKILSLGTFSDPRKVVSLIDAAGNHAATNLQLGEMKALYDYLAEIDSSKIVSADLTEYITGSGDSSDQIPRAGDGNFSEIQRYVRSIFIDGFIKKEGAVVDVLNGTTVAGAATAKADELSSYGYKLGTIGDAPSNNYAATKLYDLSDGRAEFTKRYLEQRLKTTAVSGRDLPDGITSSADFVIIVGADATR